MAMSEVFIDVLQDAPRRRPQLVDSTGDYKAAGTSLLVLHASESLQEAIATVHDLSGTLAELVKRNHRPGGLTYLVDAVSAVRKARMCLDAAEAGFERGIGRKPPVTS